MKAHYTKEKPYVDEMRLINGVVMVWTGKAWITEKEWEKMYKTEKQTACQ